MTQPTKHRWAFSLYVNGASTASLRAIASVRRLGDHEPDGQLSLEIIDVLQHPSQALRDSVFTAPTLVRRRPLPERRIVGGDLSDVSRLRARLELDAAGELPRIRQATNRSR